MNPHALADARTETVVLTDDLLEAGLSDAGGWCKAQLAALGVKWPPRKGWRRNLIGSTISRQRYEQFLALKKNRAAKEDPPAKPQSQILSVAANELAFFTGKWIERNRLTAAEALQLLAGQMATLGK